jgi:hypothetical protein
VTAAHDCGGGDHGDRCERQVCDCKCHRPPADIRDRLRQLTEAHAAATCEIRDCDGPVVARGMCNKHYLRAKSAGEFVPARRFVDMDDYLHSHSVMAGNCWEWTSKRNARGYGCGRFGGKNLYTHRASYLEYVGEIPDGYHLDHLCRNPACMRPDHLEAVPPYVNYMRGISTPAKNKRKTHCKRGHEFTPENTRQVVTKYGRQGRVCRACANAHDRRYRAQARGAAA